MSLVDQVSDNIRAIKGDFTFAQLSQRSGLDEGHINRILKGRRNLTLNSLEKLAESLGYDVQIKFQRRKPSPKNN